MKSSIRNRMDDFKVFLIEIFLFSVNVATPLVGGWLFSNIDPLTYIVHFKTTMHLFQASV